MEITNIARPRVLFEFQVEKMSGLFEFQVEKIIGISRDGTYQVQWAPAWVSRNHLVECENLIQEFLQEQMQREINGNNGIKEINVPLQGDDGDRRSEMVSSCRQKSSEILALDLNSPPLLQKASEMDAALDSKVLVDESDVSSTEVSDRSCTDCISLIMEELVNLVAAAVGDDGICNSSPVTNSKLYALTVDERSPVTTIITSTNNSTIGYQNTNEMSDSTPQGNSSSDNAKNLRGSSKKLCTFCGKSVSRQHLKVHMLLHTGIRPFECQLCGKTFFERRKRDRHMIVHSGEKNFQCGFCGKFYRRKDYRNEHSKKCTGKDGRKRFSKKSVSCDAEHAILGSQEAASDSREALS